MFNVAYDRRSVLIWRRCNMLYTSGFVDDVTISCNRPYCSVTLPQQPRCNLMHSLTPLLRVIGCAKTRQVLCARGKLTGAKYMQCTIALIAVIIYSDRSFTSQLHIRAK